VAETTCWELAYIEDIFRNKKEMQTSYLGAILFHPRPISPLIEKSRVLCPLTGQCVHWTIRPLDNASIGQCVPWSTRPF
jgi:hypothetical protein